MTIPFPLPGAPCECDGDSGHRCRPGWVTEAEWGNPGEQLTKLCTTGVGDKQAAAQQ